MHQCVFLAAGMHLQRRDFNLESPTQFRQKNFFVVLSPRIHQKNLGSCPCQTLECLHQGLMRRWIIQDIRTNNPIQWVVLRLEAVSTKVFSPWECSNETSTRSKWLRSQDSLRVQLCSIHSVVASVKMTRGNRLEAANPIPTTPHPEPNSRMVELLLGGHLFQTFCRRGMAVGQIRRPVVSTIPEEDPGGAVNCWWISTERVLSSGSGISMGAHEEKIRRGSLSEVERIRLLQACLIPMVAMTPMKTLECTS
jgi:hypothetical protein